MFAGAGLRGSMGGRTSHDPFYDALLQMLAQEDFDLGGNGGTLSGIASTTAGGHPRCRADSPAEDVRQFAMRDPLCHGDPLRGARAFLEALQRDSDDIKRENDAEYGPGAGQDCLNFFMDKCRRFLARSGMNSGEAGMVHGLTEQMRGHGTHGTRGMGCMHSQADAHGIGGAGGMGGMAGADGMGGMAGAGGMGGRAGAGGMGGRAGAGGMGGAGHIGGMSGMGGMSDMDSGDGMHHIGDTGRMNPMGGGYGSSQMNGIGVREAGLRASGHGGRGNCHGQQARPAGHGPHSPRGGQGHFSPARSPFARPRGYDSNPDGPRGSSMGYRGPRGPEYYP